MATRTIAEVEAEIVIVRAAILGLAQGGASYTINSGGSIRTFTGVDIGKLRSLLSDLKKELACLEDPYDNAQGMTIGAGW